MRVKNNPKISIIGLWHLGCVTSACLANFGYNVIGYDKDKKIVKNLLKGKVPILELGLEELIKKNINGKRLQFSNNLKEVVCDANYILLTIDTPVDEQDMVDLSSINDVIYEISRFITDQVTIIICSQIPVGTSKKYIEIIKQKRQDIKFGLAYCPENLRLGNAIKNFENPDRIIIGVENKETANKVLKFFDVLNCPKIIMSLEEAEMTKHAINSFLATCISFANSVGNLCNKIGIDMEKVSEGLMSESRIGNKLPLRAGMGFAGGTLGRDLRILEKIGEQNGNKMELVKSVLKVNHEQNILIVSKLKEFFHSLEDLTIGILGLTYKAGTNTLRRSTSIEIINELLVSNSKVRAYDPAITEIKSITNNNFQLYNDPYLVVKGVDILIILTDWPEFQKLNYKEIYNNMKRPIILDMKNCLNKIMLKKIGFNYIKFN